MEKGRSPSLLHTPMGVSGLTGGKVQTSLSPIFYMRINVPI